ncbi:MAG: putative quinol monooxygenase [Hyphomonadaceae bacterium]|nr:putative quinol monooxygenase [Hyphomonadaceae bacterium]
MIVLAGTVRIAPGQRERALPHLRAMVAASRREAGCLDYAFAFDVEDENLVRIFECFVDAEALQAHRNSAHMRVWRESWADLGIGERDMKLYVVADRRVI